MRRHPRRRGRPTLILERLSAFFAAAEFSWLDVLDILIVAFIIYQLLQFIRGTHAVQMALGALVLVLLYWISQLLQPGDRELAAAHLPALRGLRHHRGLPGRDPEGAGPPRQDPAARAPSARSARRRSSTRWCWPPPPWPSQRTGAIMVIEREMGLRSYIETGIALDALVTYDLLISIFNPARRCTTAR